MEDKDQLTEEVIERMLNLNVPGHVIETDPHEADAFGAFHEDAITESEALDSAIDEVDE